MRQAAASSLCRPCWPHGRCGCTGRALCTRSQHCEAPSVDDTPQPSDSYRSPCCTACGPVSRVGGAHEWLGTWSTFARSTWRQAHFSLLRKATAAPHKQPELCPLSFASWYPGVMRRSASSCPGEGEQASDRNAHLGRHESVIPNPHSSKRRTDFDASARPWHTGQWLGAHQIASTGSMHAFAKAHAFGSELSARSYRILSYLLNASICSVSWFRLPAPQLAFKTTVPEPDHNS